MSITAARLLGGFSIGLGLAELLAPRAVGRPLSLGHRPNLLRAYGLRELAVGVPLLFTKRPRPWLMARVAGDLLDLATLGSTLKDRNRRPTVVLGLAAVLGVTALDILFARRA